MKHLVNSFTGPLRFIFISELVANSICILILSFIRLLALILQQPVFILDLQPLFPFDTLDFVLKSQLSLFIMSDADIPRVVEPDRVVIIFQECALHPDNLVEVYFLNVVANFINLFQAVPLLVVPY